jgi:hypothetical protein
MAAPDAVMFAPAMVLAQPWLRDRPNPPVALTWQPHRVWSSCDGSLMVTSGAWQKTDGQKAGGRQGWFTTVWQRQPDGAYRWVLDHGDTLAEPLAVPDMIAARVAECPQRRAGPRPAAAPPARLRAARKPAKAPPVPFDPAAREGRSQDGTLVWQVTADGAGGRSFVARLRGEGGGMEAIREERVAPPAS